MLRLLAEGAAKNPRRASAGGRCPARKFPADRPDGSDPRRRSPATGRRGSSSQSSMVSEPSGRSAMIWTTVPCPVMNLTRTRRKPMELSTRSEIAAIRAATPVSATKRGSSSGASAFWRRRVRCLANFGFGVRRCVQFPSVRSRVKQKRAGPARAPLPLKPSRAITKMLTGRYIIESRLRRKDLLRDLYCLPAATRRAKKKPPPAMAFAGGGRSL